MRGLPEHNFPMFMAAADELTDAGHEVYNPAALDDNTFTPESNGAALAVELAWICLEAEMVVVLPGWHRSLGATAETAAAAAVGIPVSTLSEFLNG